MIRYILLIGVLISASCKYFSEENTADDADELPIAETLDECLKRISNDSTWFPAAFEDYNPDNLQAKAAFPLNNGTSRIWVKGSADFSIVNITDLEGKVLVQNIALEPPYFTKIIELDAANNLVKAIFLNRSGSSAIVDSIGVISHKIFEPATESFSLMFYGCFEPFTIDTARTPRVLFSATNPVNKNMRNLWNLVAFSNQIQYESYDQEGEKTGESLSSLIQNPVAIFGTGDQIYTDAGYNDAVLPGHPTSAWAHVCNNPYPLLNIKAFEQHLHRCYQSFYSFQPIAATIKKIPSFNVWDDHEIRDGWGSHGDEYDAKGKLNDTLAPYYLAARKAFIDHQWIIGPVKKNSAPDNDAALSLDFKIKGVPVFALDLRSGRNIKTKTVIHPSQMNDFRVWCKNLQSGQEVVIITSIPLFAEAIGESMASETMEEMKDDIQDSWENNKDQKDLIIKELIKLRERNIQPILVAGDLHYGSITEVWYMKDDKKKLLAYEIIASGLNHETLGENNSALGSNIKDYREDSDWDSEATRVYLDKPVQYYTSIRFSKVDLNFSAIEFHPGKNTFINVFTTGEDQKGFAQYRLEVNWNKTYEQEEEERTHSVKDRLLFSFTPPKVPYRKFRIK